MPRSQELVTLLVLACLVGGAGIAGVASAELVATDGGQSEQETTTTAAGERHVTVDVDCNRSQVVLTAPESYQSDLTVAVVNVTPTGSAVSSSSVAPVAGNETVDFTGEGIVFAFVGNHSAADELVATDVTDCTRTGEVTTTTTPADVEPDVRINCTESVVRFIASEETSYLAKVTVVSVSPEGASTSSTTRTVEGNATVSFDGQGLVAAFASTGTLGDDRTVSAIRDCTVEADRPTTTQTETETGAETETA